MVLPAVAWAVASSSLLFVASPRFPHYQVTSFRLVSLSILPLLFTWHLSCVIKVEVMLDNSNFVGAEVHGTLIDMYVPTPHSSSWWSSSSSTRNDDEHCSNNDDGNDKSKTNECRFTHHDLRVLARLRDAHNHEKSSTQDNNLSSSRSGGDNPSPVHLPARNKAVPMYNNLLTITNLSPGTMWHIVRDVVSWGGAKEEGLAKFGELRVLSTGVAHVRTNALVRGKGNSGKEQNKGEEVGKGSLAGWAHQLGSAAGSKLTVSILCSTVMNTLEVPAKVVSRTCSSSEVFPGWIDAEKESERLLKELEARFRSTGSVVRLRGGADIMGGQRRDQSEAVELWHDF